MQLFLLFLLWNAGLVAGGYTPEFYHDIQSVDPEYLWIVILGGMVCWCASWGIGANDTSNNWGSAVGSKAINVRYAAILACIFEVTGAFTLGSTVGGTVKRKIVPPKFYCDDQFGLVTRMVGMMSVDMGVATWLFISCKLGMPVSTTHAAVGGVCGFGIVSRGWGVVTWWDTMGMIFISWATSPLLSTLIAFCLQWTIRRFLFTGEPGSIYRKNHLYLPLVMGIFVGLAAVFAFYIGGKGNDNVKSLPAWPFITVWLAVTFAAIVILYVLSFYLRRRWNIDMDAYKGFEPPTIHDSSSSKAHDDDPHFDDLGDAPHPSPIPSAATFLTGDKMGIKDIYEGMSAEQIASEQLWIPMCWIVASIESFAHGANDVGNSIGPYSALIDSYNGVCPNGTKSIPYWILGLGASGILVGLVTYGHKVIKTMGVDIAVITPQRAACAEVGTVITILIATGLAIPVSTTHCCVGGITGVSLVGGVDKVNWKTIANVAICIVLTVPGTAFMVSAIFGYTMAAMFGANYPGPSAFQKYANETSPGPWILD